MVKLYHITLTIIFFLALGGKAFPQLAIVDSTFDLPTVIDTVNSVSVDYKTRPGFLQLETGERENLAKNKWAYIVYLGASPSDTGQRNALRLLDGLYSSPSYIQIPPIKQGGLPGSYIMIDLKAIRTIKKVSIFTLGNNANLRPRAFSVYTGVDTAGMEKVYQENDNQVASPTIQFDPKNARYVKIIFDVLADNNSTVISEIEIYGVGFLPQGIFYSVVRDLKKKVNIGTVQYVGTKPAGTGINFSFRTGNTSVVDTSWSEWSSEVAGNNDLFDVYEPRQYLQYKIRLTTDTLTSPEIDLVRINYDTLNVITNAIVGITPLYAQILKEQEFTLTIQTTFSPTDLGIDSIYILTPSPAQLTGVQVNNVNVSYTAKVTFDYIKVALANTVKTSGNIKVIFKETPFLDNKQHPVYVSSKLVARNSQQVDTYHNDKYAGWNIVTIGVPDKLLNGVKAEPNPFSPNGDGLNDVAQIQFFLGNIAEPSNYIAKEVRQLTVKIFDLRGRLTRTIYDGPVKASAFVASNSFNWDGTDDSGNIVRPGLYIYQIAVDSDNGGEQSTKTIVVAY